MIRPFALLACACLVEAAAASAAAQAITPGSNVARGRPYSLTPRPNYSLTTDTGDNSQLTDGAYTTGTMWLQPAAVGWSNATPVTIVVDLQTVQPIAGLSYSTAAGKAGVSWPRSIFVLTSDDGQRFFPAGDLVSGPDGPPATGFAAFRFTTRALHTHGRYVAFVVDAVGPYTFSDEIEVYAGDASWLAAPLAGPATTNLTQFFTTAHMMWSIRHRLMRDVQRARDALAAADVDDGTRAALQDELADIDAAIPALQTPDPATFKAVLPLNDLHARVFAVHGAIAEAQAAPLVAAWPANPWSFLDPLDRPAATDGAPAFVWIVAMTGERRSAAINLANLRSYATSVSLRLVSADGSPVPDVSLYEAVWTDTRELIPVADALLPLSTDAPSLDIPAGMTRQLWLHFSPVDRSPGTYPAFVEITNDDGVWTSIPIELNVLAGRFPERPTLHLGGFDYTDADAGLGLTAGNRNKLVAALHDLAVDAPWAKSRVMPFGSFDALGQLAVPPDTSRFAAWVAQWPAASRYCVFINAGDSIAGIASTDPRFVTAVGQWIAFWVDQAARRGIRASQLVLLITDEPQNAAQETRVMRWTAAIKAAAPGVVIWEDPLYANPATASSPSTAVSDIVAVNRALVVQQGAAFADFYRGLVAGGQSLDVYGSSGPVRPLDPYTYHRLQAWTAVSLDATGSQFWSFADDAGGRSWNEYAAVNTPFSPFFLSATDVTISKHSEAIREGVEDVEYLFMLRRQTEAVRGVDPTREGLSDVVAFASTAVAQVLQAAGANDFDWTTDKDRTAAEAMRLQIAEMLAGGVLELNAPSPPGN